MTKKVAFSRYLQEAEGALSALRGELEKKYGYVSVYAADSAGFSLRAGQRNVRLVEDTMTSERGVCVRVMQDGICSEYAFNPAEYFADPKAAAEKIGAKLDAQLSMLKNLGVEPYPTPELPDGGLEIFAEFEAETAPEEADRGALLDELRRISAAGMELDERLIDVEATASSTHISKMFLTKNRTLKQSYVYSEGNVIAFMAKDGKTARSVGSVSGRCGAELFKDLAGRLESTVANTAAVLTADRIEPGEYTIITNPEVTGLIAHEAFGHGVEMDMFVKERALGKEYIGKRVGSPLVTMHEGALAAVEVSSYAFDDEGTPAQDTVEIDKGILRTGICDALSAMRLGTSPTGNGKRESYSHKAYTRMTNTVFEAGNDTLEEMIASTDYGFLLENMRSGMEDPKHWGIQCIIERGLEIKDGKLTGRVVSPVVLTGYVPDVLGNITMAGRKVQVFGSGCCGKGYKEWVKVSDGGPCLKTKARLG